MSDVEQINEQQSSRCLLLAVELNYWKLVWVDPVEGAHWNVRLGQGNVESEIGQSNIESYVVWEDNS